MNKYTLLMTMVFFLVLITLVVGSIDATATSNIFIEAAATSEAPRLLNILGAIWNYMTIFFRMLAFQVNGIPEVFNILVFYPLTAGIIFMIVDIIRGNG
jgi:hypothetical protein